MSNDRKVLKLPTVPKGVDRVSQTVDNIHDKIATANANITQAVTTAKKAMSGVSMSDVMSMTPRECLIPLKRVMDALNLIKGIHPFVGLAVTAFEVVLSLEMKRRENDKRVSGIFLKKADMMMALLQLDTIKDVDMKNDQGETVAGRMQTIIAAIKKDIETCGNVIDTYYDQKFLAKFLRAGSWEDTFIGFASIFEKRKEDIKLALAIHVTIKMDIVADQVSSIDVKMDMLIRLFKDQSPKEKTLAAKVEELGGIEECIRSDRLLAQLDKPSDGEPVGSTVSQSLKPSTSLLVSVRTPLETLFDDHKAYFDVLIKSETKWIDNAIQRSTRRIISAIGDGPWKRIQDLDIRQVWKGMNAPSSVKARYFVLALHDHYIDQYENISALASIQLDRDIVPPSPTLSHAETEATNGDVDTGFLQNPPPEADKWCLEYLSIQNIPAIAEAIDDDVSGFIKIAEVNNFSYDKPEGFSMLRWVTFWAAGSAVEASIYHVRIEALIEKLLDVPVKAENRGESYPDYTYCLLCISWLLRSRPHVTTENAELIDLIRQHMKLQEKAITDSLEPAKWEIDQAGTVSTLLGPGRIEKYLYPTLYLVLRYHYQVLSLGSTHVLDDREIEAAYNTLWSLLDACDTRMSVLAAAFDQQPGVDGFKRFAGGLFKNWNTRNPISRQSEVPIDAMPPFELKDEEYAMEDQLEYSPGTVISLESLLQGHDPRVGHHELDVGQLHYGIVDTSKQLDESEDHRAYIDLYKKQIILEYADDELNDVDTAKMKELECIPESERHSCQQIASREISKGGYHSWTCNGCGMTPILGAHYQCIGCLIDVGDNAFDLCQNCVLQLPEEPDRDCSSHASSHPMIRFRFVVGYILRMRNREKALEIVKTLENASNTAFTCKGPCGKVDVCGIHFRCIQCEDYILCADCISSYESDQVDYHSLSHIFIRFSGEPLIFHPKQEEGTVSDQARMANIEAVLGKFEERLAKQEHVMQSLTEELSAIRMTMEKGFQLKKE